MSIIRTDVLQINKSITISMSKELNLAFKGICFKSQLSPTEVIVEFIDQVVRETKSANSILKSASIKKFNKSLNRIKEADVKRKTIRNTRVGELDSESLYAILENLKEAEKNVEND